MDPDSVERAGALWRDAGIHLSGEPMTLDSLPSLFDKTRERIRESAGRFIPTAFDPDTDLTVYPRDPAWTWKSAVDIFAEHAGAGVMMRLPLFWQAEMPLFDACRRSGTFIFINDRGNMPLGAAAIARSSMEVVVTDAEDANTFAQFLMQQGLRFPKAWLVIQRGDVFRELSPALTNSGSAIYREVHVLPCMPVMTQCEHMVNIENIFHLDDDFFFELGTNTLVTGGRGDPLPLVRFAMGLNMKAGSLCACGKRTVRVGRL